jgi:hypothetical protein
MSASQDSDLFDRLPDDLLSLIFGHVPRRWSPNMAAMVSLLTVSRRWNVNITLETSVPFSN